VKRSKTDNKKDNSPEGKRIRQRRLQLGLTQEDLAREVGVTSHTIWRLETDADFNPRLQTLKLIATALRVNVSSLIK
jgi:transcriptional regulator with XRE-family HTH domain